MIDRRLVIVCCIGVGLIATAIAVWLVLALAASSPTRVTDVSAYQDVLSQWQPTGLIDHFPEQIPSEESSARLSYMPGFLQGGSHFQLRLELPASEIERIEADVQQLTEHRYRGGTLFEHYNADSTNNVPATDFFTGNDPDDRRFPDHFDLYVLEATPGSGPSWNNGRTCGVAVSSVSGEVVYWAHEW